MRPFLLIGLLFVAACHRSQPTAEPTTPSTQQKRAERAAAVPPARQQQWTYLNRLRQGEAFNSAIARTMVNEKNRLGLVLFSRVQPDEVPELMRKIMAEMAQEFPHQEITLGVYEEAVPPREIGEAQLNGETGETEYVAAK